MHGFSLQLRVATGENQFIARNLTLNYQPVSPVFTKQKLWECVRHVPTLSTTYESLKARQKCAHQAHFCSWQILLLKNLLQHPLTMTIIDKNLSFQCLKYPCWWALIKYNPLPVKTAHYGNTLHELPTTRRRDMAGFTTPHITTYAGVPMVSSIPHQPPHINFALAGQLKILNQPDCFANARWAKTPYLGYPLAASLHGKLGCKLGDTESKVRYPPFSNNYRMPLQRIALFQKI